MYELKASGMRSQICEHGAVSEATHLVALVGWSVG